MTIRISVLLLLATACGWSQAVPPEEEAEWVKIRQIKSLYEEAVSSNQIERLRPYIANGFRGVMVTGHEARTFEDLQRINQEIRNLIGAGGSYQVKVNYEPGVMAGNVALAHGNANETIVTGSGKRYEFTSTWLVNLVRQDGEWKLYRIQATMDPVTNVFVMDTVRYTRMAFGAGGLLLGVLIGFVIRTMRR